jgi:two-component system LytT family response regulator
VNTLLIDDELNVLEALKEMLKLYCPEVNIIGSCGSIAESEEFLQTHEVDLVFLDIELRDGTGLELLNRLEKKDFQLIFVTAYNHYAIEAFKYSSVDYLLKPVDPDDLIEAVMRAHSLMDKSRIHLQLKTLLSNFQDLSLQNRKLIVSDKEEINALPIKDILYLQADGAYTRFYLKDRHIISSKNLKSYESLLKNAGFFRTHHSYLVNLAHMVSFSRHDNVLFLQDGVNVPVSSRKRELLLERIKDFTFL